MGASITVNRSPELRGRQGTYEVTIDDDDVVGTLDRGQPITHPVDAWKHTVQVVRDPQHTSPRQQVDVEDDQQLVLYASYIYERASYVRSPTRPSDHLVVTTDGSISNGDGTAGTPQETRARQVLLAVAVIGFFAARLVPNGPVRTTLQLISIVAVVVGFVLLMRHFRHLYSSPR